MKILVVIGLIFLCGCTISTTTDYIHQDTHKLRRYVIWKTGSVEFKEQLVLIPSFRQFSESWGTSRRADLWILSKSPASVYIDTVKLTGPNGTPVLTRRIDSNVAVNKILNRQTTLSERLSSGGFFKGKRVAGTDYYFHKHFLIGPGKEFVKDVHSLDLEISASIDDGPLKLFKFHLDYNKRVSPEFITR